MAHYVQIGEVASPEISNSPPTEEVAVRVPELGSISTPLVPNFGPSNDAYGCSFRDEEQNVFLGNAFNEARLGGQMLAKEEELRVEAREAQEEALTSALLGPMAMARSRVPKVAKTLPSYIKGLVRGGKGGARGEDIKAFLKKNHISIDPDLADELEGLLVQDKVRNVAKWTPFARNLIEKFDSDPYIVRTYFHRVHGLIVKETTDRKGRTSISVYTRDASRHIGSQHFPDLPGLDSETMRRAVLTIIDRSVEKGYP